MAITAASVRRIQLRWEQYQEEWAEALLGDLRPPNRIDECLKDLRERMPELAEKLQVHAARVRSKKPFDPRPYHIELQKRRHWGAELAAIGYDENDPSHNELSPITVN